LIEGDRAGRFELLELKPEPTCWRSYGGIGVQRAVLKPDSFVRLGLGPYEDSYFIEVDRGTEGSRALEAQMRAYGDYHRSGAEQAAHGVFPKVLWLVPDRRRLAVVTDAVAAQPRAARGLFAAALFTEALSVVTNMPP
jgi:Replication-relaxation